MEVGIEWGHPFMREGAETGNFRNREKCYNLIKGQHWGSFNTGLLEIGKLSADLDSQQPETQKPLPDD